MRCCKCSIKIKLYLNIMTCKCGNRYCNKCKISHKCEYNYIGENKKRLKEKLTKVEGKKLDKI